VQSAVQRHDVQLGVQLEPAPSERACSGQPHHLHACNDIFEQHRGLLGAPRRVSVVWQRDHDRGWGPDPSSRSLSLERKPAFLVADKKLVRIVHAAAKTIASLEHGFQDTFDVAVNSAGEVLVTDVSKHQVVLFDQKLDF
jgi:hypothetical protein